ncbi:ATP-dependent helicase [Oerskovia flava]|uniref:ATP-dependent helicase n=1 Tax=Oerskovia flava TaxID=2986422 RepID=UPI00223F9D87|nr:ATP-dependent DNA helicase [Oerskovia sp. JB1-3-2]
MQQTTTPWAPRLVLPAERGAATVELDDAQAGAVEAGAHGRSTLVVGAPGTGKTLVGLEIAGRALAAGTAPERVLVLAASRRAAAELRDRLAARADRTVSAPMVRTAASAAFLVLRERASALGEPAPTLISGPEQDLVLAELLAGHLDGDGVPLRLPPGLPEEVLGLRGLRQELRDLLMRAAERGLAPPDLAGLGERYDRPEWVTAAQVYQEYLDVTALGTATPDLGSRFDPAVVVDEAAAALRAWEDEVPEVPRPRWDLVVVDDYQEATVATARLLEALHDDGARVVLLADPDSAVQAFRGASPGLVGRASVERRPGGAGAGELGAAVHVLGTAWRQDVALRAVTRTVTSQVGTVAGAVHRGAEAVLRGTEAEGGAEAEGEPGAAGPEVAPRGARVAILPSAAQEAAYVARELRAEHLLHATPWSRMAVITRTGTQLAALRRALVASSVPVGILGSDVPLRDEPAVHPLLAAMQVALAGERAADELAPETAAGLLTSPLGGLDVVALRRLRRALRAEELSGGGGRTSDALLVEVVLDEARAQTLPPTVRRGVVALARVLDAGRAAAAVPGASAQTVLWALWSATGLAERWRSAALDGGATGARADRDLDAVLALFRAAETFVDRMPGAPPSAFVEYLRSQDLPADSLAATASGADAVAALTPAGAAGREWDVVVVAGVQDGVWPDLRLRDSLLGSQALVELLAGRSDDAHGLGPDARKAVLADELRSFAVATSRAARRLLVTAVSDVEEVPSPFVDLVEPPPGPDESPDGGPEDGPDGGPGAGGPESAGNPADPRRVTVGEPLDLRGLVAAARSILVEDAMVERADASGAADLLAGLAQAGVGEADPDTWYGVSDVSSSDPLWGPQDTVGVSPSKVESVSTCALRWALESAGGTAPDATAQTLGNLIHSIAQDAPDGGHAELKAELARRWPELALKPGWPATQTRRRAEGMIERLAGYVQDSGEALLVEAPFEVKIGRAVLRGVVDRVEDAGEGAVVVADLKTGRSKPSVTETLTNPQLGAYQLAVEEGALDVPDGTRSAGGRLVFLADGAKAGLRTQGVLAPEPDGRSWARTLVEDVAETMADSVFVARENKLCTVCPVRRSCPVQAEGRQVVA